LSTLLLLVVVEDKRMAVTLVMNSVVVVQVRLFVKVYQVLNQLVFNRILL
jgi:hypothetical protein